MTGEEKQKAINALKISAPIMAMTQEEFNDYIQTLNKIMDWLEQEPILDRDCEHCSKTYGTLGCCTTVSNKWVYSCKEGQREYLLDQIRAEIDEQYDKVHPYNLSCADGLEMALGIIEKYKSESEE